MLLQALKLSLSLEWKTESSITGFTSLYIIMYMQCHTMSTCTCIYYVLHRFNDKLKVLIEEEPTISLIQTPFSTMSSSHLFDYLFLVWNPGTVYMMVVINKRRQQYFYPTTACRTRSR